MKGSWPLGLTHATRHAYLTNRSKGEMVASLIIRLVEATARESLKAQAFVAIDEDGGLIIEAAESSRAEWVGKHFSRWVVGTYGLDAAPEQIEDDLCLRLAEVKQAMREAA